MLNGARVIGLRPRWYQRQVDAADTVVVVAQGPEDDAHLQVGADGGQFFRREFPCEEVVAEFEHAGLRCHVGYQSGITIVEDHTIHDGDGGLSGGRAQEQA